MPHSCEYSQERNEAFGEQMRKLIRCCVYLLVLLACRPLFAEQHRLQDDFTFKRVGVPTPGSGNRITIQVTPETSSIAPETIPQDGTSNDVGAYAWFWESVSPDLSANAPGRLDEAISTLRDAPDGFGVAAPSLNTLQTIISEYGSDILINTVGTDVSPALVVALISVESAGDIGAVSSAGASGLMQLMPDTAARFGVTDIQAPADNIKGGVAYLAWLMGHFNNDPILVLAGYNAGEGAVRDHNGVPAYAETRNYVPKVIAAWAVARALCLTPPELMSDGCAFTIGG